MVAGKKGSREPTGMAHCATSWQLPLVKQNNLEARCARDREASLGQQSSMEKVPRKCWNACREQILEKPRREPLLAPGARLLVGRPEGKRENTYARVYDIEQRSRDCGNSSRKVAGKLCTLCGKAVEVSSENGN